MLSILKEFRKNVWFLPKTHAFHAVLFLGVNALMVHFGAAELKLMLLFTPVFLMASSIRIEYVTIAFVSALMICLMEYGPELTYLGLMAAAIFITFPLTMLLHNAAHGSIRPIWLNRVAGEIAGLCQLSCYADWVVVHSLHHSHSDDKELDPHSPGTMGYFDFLMGIRQSVSRIFGRAFMKQHDGNHSVQKALKAFGLLSKMRQFLWVMFWFQALGPKGFTFFFLFSIVFKMVHYAWFNWSTHRVVDGKVEILNLDHGFYVLINKLSANLYYHKNHHINSTLFNPKSLDVEPQKEVPLAG